MATFPFILIKHVMQRKSVPGKVVSVMRVSPNTMKATNLMVYNDNIRRTIGTYSRNPTLTMIPNNLFATNITTTNNNNNNNNILASSSSLMEKQQKLFSTHGCSDGSKKNSKKEIDNTSSRHHLKELRDNLSNCLNKPDHAPDEATNILQQMLRHHPRTVHVNDCNKVLRAWNKVSRQEDGPKGAPKKALNLLKQMIKIGNVNKNSNVKPTVTSYNLVIEAFAYKGDINNSRLVFDILSNDFKTNKKTKPNGNSYLRMIYACSRSTRDKDAPKIAKNILATMTELNTKGELKDRPNLVDYKTTMNACARNGDVDGAISILETIENDNTITPDNKVYAILIHALSKSRDVGSPNKAIQILNKMNDLYREGILEDGPNEATYDSVMDTCAAHGDVLNANLVLTIMMDHFNAGNNNAKPGVIMYNILINVISKSKHDTAPDQAKILLENVVQMHSNRQLEGSVDAITYTSVIDAYASRGDIQGARDVLVMMEKDFKSGNKDAKPNMITYTSLINAWAKSRLDIAPYEAKKLLKKMIELHQQGILNNGPNMITYTSVIDAYALHGDIQGANIILSMMEEDFKLGNKNAKPNMITYSALINVWSKSGENDAPYQAKNILKKMIELHQQRYLDEGPNAITYNSVIDAYASHGDIQGANDILSMMESDFKSGNKNAKPDRRTYTVLINAWSKSGEKDAPYQAENILKKMINMFSEGLLTRGPNTISFNSVINAYAEQGDPDGANNILEMMEDYVKSGNIDAKPSIQTYTTLIKAWYKSNTTHAPKEVEIIFQKINNLHKSGDLKYGPDNVTYKLMIRCLRKYKGCKKRINQLQLMLKDVRKK